MTSFVINHGLSLLVLVVMVESFGIPLPGETALIAFGVLASQGHYAIAEVIALAALAAIIGDNLGYWVIGRWGGRRLLERWNWSRRYTHRVLPRAERVMQRHGGKTVFIGRFVSVLRYTVAWIAGLTRMNPWWFLVWNMAGGIAWATAVGLLAYSGGNTLAAAVQRDGLYGVIGLIAILLAGWLVLHFAKRRVEERL